MCAACCTAGCASCCDACWATFCMTSAFQALNVCRLLCCRLCRLLLRCLLGCHWHDNRPPSVQCVRPAVLPAVLPRNTCCATAAWWCTLGILFVAGSRDCGAACGGGSSSQDAALQWSAMTVTVAVSCLSVMHSDAFQCDPIRCGPVQCDAMRCAMPVLRGCC